MRRESLGGCPLDLQPHPIELLQLSVGPKDQRVREAEEGCRHHAAPSLPLDRERGAGDELARPPSLPSPGDVSTRCVRARRVGYGVRRRCLVRH